ncbi:uncharacterized protein LOC5573909 [Aedes aegypti]|uniref:Uncharacterized protein n=1 Tax=Aedes aegypti TaxID=7159 RepID=A0A1S4F170_AEDAE|nr:uncharacterized protein LOC5573909 [Aedes aegypti]
MKFFIAFLALAFAAAEAGYAPAAVPVRTSVWPAYSLYGKNALSAWPYGHNYWNNGWNNGWNTWNNGWNSWNNDGHGLYGGYPYAGAWSPAYYGGHKTVVQANLGKPYAYGLPWGSYGAGVHGWTGHHGGYLPSVVPVSKQVAATPESVHVAAVPVGAQKVVVA